MRKVLLSTMFVFGFISANAQDVDFGVTAGFINTTAKVKALGSTVSDSEAGFYVGGIVDISMSEKFSLRPELLYANINEGSALMIPVLLKYGIIEKLYLEGGLQLTFDLESDDVKDYSKTTLQLPLGIGYDITKNFFIEGRYAMPLTNNYTGDLDIKVKQSFLTIGLGYKF